MKHYTIKSPKDNHKIEALFKQIRKMLEDGKGINIIVGECK